MFLSFRAERKNAVAVAVNAVGAQGSVAGQLAGGGLVCGQLGAVFEEEEAVAAAAQLEAGAAAQGGEQLGGCVH